MEEEADVVVDVDAAADVDVAVDVDAVEEDQVRYRFLFHITDRPRAHPKSKSQSAGSSPVLGKSRRGVIDRDAKPTKKITFDDSSSEEEIKLSDAIFEMNDEPKKTTPRYCERTRSFSLCVLVCWASVL